MSAPRTRLAPAKQAPSGEQAGPLVRDLREMGILHALRERGVTICQGVATREQRQHQIAEALRIGELADVTMATYGGKPLSFGRAYARAYGEPLIPDTTRASVDATDSLEGQRMARGQAHTTTKTGAPNGASRPQPEGPSC